MEYGEISLTISQVKNLLKQMEESPHHKEVETPFAVLIKRKGKNKDWELE